MIYFNSIRNHFYKPACVLSVTPHDLGYPQVWFARRTHRARWWFITMKRYRLKSVEAEASHSGGQERSGTSFPLSSPSALTPAMLNSPSCDVWQQVRSTANQGSSQKSWFPSYLLGARHLGMQHLLYRQLLRLSPPHPLPEKNFKLIQSGSGPLGNKTGVHLSINNLARPMTLGYKTFLSGRVYRLFCQR